MKKIEIIENNFNERFWKIYSEQHLENAKQGIGMTPYPLNEELKDARERLLYLKRHLGSDAYINLMNQYDREKQIKEQSKK